MKDAVRRVFNLKKYDNEEIATDIAYTSLDFGNCIDKVEFIAVVGGEFGSGKILKHFE